MASIDPPDLSPYLTQECRDMRTACKALARHANRRTPCGACPVSDLCDKSSKQRDPVWRRNAFDTQPRVALASEREPEIA